MLCICTKQGYRHPLAPLASQFVSSPHRSPRELPREVPRELSRRRVLSSKLNPSTPREML